MVEGSTRGSAPPWNDPARLAVMFASGLLATLIFHQGVFAILYGAGVIGGPPFRMDPTWPLGVPQVISIAFWGGVWGLIFSCAEPRFPRGAGYWIAALAFGAVFPTLVAWFVVFPLKGIPVASGLEPTRMMIGLLLNGAWGLGTALIFWAIARKLGWWERTPGR